MTLHEIEDANDPLLLQACDLYESAFPPSERSPVSWNFDHLCLRNNTADRIKELVVAIAPDTPDRIEGFARYLVRPESELLYLTYFAVAPNTRRKRIGTTMFAAICERARLRYPMLRFLTLQAEAPNAIEDPEARELAIGRIAFWERVGIRFVEGIDHMIEHPPYPPVPMRIGYYNLNGGNNEQPSGDEILNIIARQLVFTTVPERME